MLGSSTESNNNARIPQIKKKNWATSFLYSCKSNLSCSFPFICCNSIKRQWKEIFRFRAYNHHCHRRHRSAPSFGRCITQSPVRLRYQRKKGYQHRRRLGRRLLWQCHQSWSHSRQDRHIGGGNQRLRPWWWRRILPSGGHRRLELRLWRWQRILLGGDIFYFEGSL